MRSTVALAIEQSISKIYAKMSETKSLLATILIREGVLLVQNRDFLVLEQRDRDFRHIGGVVLGGGGGGFVRTKRTTPGSATGAEFGKITKILGYSAHTAAIVV